MSDYHDDFFDEQKPWSRLKNRILGSYMPPYLAKVATKSKRIVLVDAFAGPGRFLDGTAGSPLIISKEAEKFAKGKYKAYFFNNKMSHHKLLTRILEKEDISAAKPIFGDAIEKLRELIAELSDETLFLYIDPYGLDCEFEILRLLLERDKRYSTEILINLHMPISHRLSSRHAVQAEDSNDSRIQSYHNKLTRVYGGDYWKKSLLRDDYDAKERERTLVDRYREKLASTEYLTYTGACPIRERTASATKYVMVFASPHSDALLLLNDNMCKSFQDHIHNQWAKDTLFAGFSWSDWRDHSKLQDVVLKYIDRFRDYSRKKLWLEIVKDHFMLFTSSEYKKAVKVAYDSGQIICTTPIRKEGTRPTKKLNDDCVFALSDQKSMF